MTAADVLARLNALGVSAWTSGEKVLLRPGSKVPPDLVAEVRQNKADLLSALTVEEPINETRPPPDAQFEDAPCCRACLCEAWNSAEQHCETCQGRLCSACSGCLSASLVWRRAQIDALYTEVPVDELLERLRKGSAWLRDQDQHYFDGDHEQAASDELFGKMWALWSDLELALRHVHGYEGCLFAPGEHCPEDGPVRCQACSGPGDNPL